MSEDAQELPVKNAQSPELSPTDASFEDSPSPDIISDDALTVFAGKLAAGELVSAAKTPAERTEALFYGAFERLIAGDSKGAEAGFKQTLSSDGAELVEVDLARELLGGRPSPGQPPANVVIP